MREFKKYFFESLLQLTILATLLRQNQNNHNLENYYYYNGLSLRTLETSLAQTALSTADRNNNNYTAHLDPYDNLAFLNENNLTYLNGNVNYREKQLPEHLVAQELRELNRLNARLQQHHNNHQNTHHQLPQYVVSPSSFYLNNNNQKDIINLSETRLLLNSIEFNNQLTKEDIEMDIDIQTIIQQDIDLGIKKSYNYDYERAAAAHGYGQSTSTDYELLKYLQENNPGSAKVDLEQNEFYFKSPLDLENQKNEDILSMENLLSTEAIPDGYKLVLEEDTGEWFLIMLRNDTVNKTCTQTVEIDPSTSLNVTSQVEENVDINVSISLFLADEALATLESKLNNNNNNNNNNQPSEPQQGSQQLIDSPTKRRVEFLSQMSVNNELGKLSLESNEVGIATKAASASASAAANTNSNMLISSLNESLNNMEENLLNETWINTFLQQQQQQGEAEQQQNEQEAKLLIDNDAMLSTLNSNNSVLMNENNATITTTNNNVGYFFDPNVTNGTTTTDQMLTSSGSTNIVNNNGAELYSTNVTGNQGFYLNNTESLELLFNPSLFDLDLSSQSNLTLPKTSINDPIEPVNLDNLLFNYEENELALVDGAAAMFFNNNNNHKQELTASALNTNDDEAKRAFVEAAEQNKSSNLINTSSLNLKQEAIDLDIEDHVLYPNMSKFEPLRRQSTAALAGLRHNHTYLNTDENDEAAGSSSSLAELHPYSYKNKLKRMLKSQQQQQNLSEMAAAARNQSRDEAILKANAIDLTLEEVVETSADDFNELIRVNEFSAEQINVLKDIRRRGKNKVAAQICRKRKLDSIDSLKEEVDELKEMKSVLISEYSEISNEIKQMTMKFDNLYKDTVGNTYDTSDPIVIFINNLKKLNSNTDTSGAHSNNNNNNNEPSNRNRKKTFNSNDSSDFDSSNQSSLLSSSDLDEDDDDYEEETPTSSSAARNKPQSGANAQKRQPTSSNKYKKLKRN